MRKAELTGIAGWNPIRPATPRGTDIGTGNTRAAR
jgi:hypothetical protein